MIVRKFYKYTEVAKLLDCSLDDLEDYVYRQYAVRPCTNYKGYVVNANHQNGSKPKLIYFEGDFEVDLSSLGYEVNVTKDGFQKSANSFISRIYKGNELYKFVHQTRGISSSEFGFTNVTSSKVVFAFQPTELQFLKSTIDKLIKKTDTSTATKVTSVQQINETDEILATKRKVKAQGFATRKELSTLTGKSKSTLSNQASTHPNTSGWNKAHKHYPIEDITKFYSISFDDV